MRLSLFQQIAPPRFADPETDRVARSVFICALIFICIDLVWIPAAYVLQGRQHDVALFGAGAFAALVGVAILARAGRARLGAGILVAALFASGTAGLWVEGGLRGTSTGTFIAVVLATSLFFSSRVSQATAIVSVLLLGAFWALGLQGLLPEPAVFGPERVFLATTVIIAIVLSLVQLNFGRIRESQKFLRAVTDAAPNALYVYDLREQRNAYGNAASMTQIGHDAGVEGGGRSFVELLHPDDLRLMIAHANRMETMRDDDIAEVEFRVRNANDEYRTIRDRVRVFDRAPDGKVRQVIGASEDVTEEREAHHALERSRERIQRGERLEALGRLAGGIAHDFNNYLTVIMGATEVAADDPSASESVREFVRDAHDAAKRSAELTRQLLGFSQQRLMRPSHFELNDLLEESDRLLRRVISENIQIELLPNAAASTIHADRSQIEQVVLNLAVNARDAMPEGGSLTLATSEENIDAVRASRHEAVEPGPFVVLEVADTGIGMDDETRAKIFEPLFTTKEASAGTGFGLATVEAVVGHCGGFVEVESELGSGTRFSIYLPRARVTDSDDGAGPLPAAYGGSERVLLVEDDVYVRSFTERSLRQSGYVVTVAADGAEGARIFHDAPNDFDLLLTDVMLPSLSGLELAAELVALRPDLRVVYMSGYAAGELAGQGLQPKDHLLDKPFTVDELNRQIRDALDRD